ncbi:MAG: bifunctional oligoribonuclease/PAP phosphatase NrnA [Acidobacteriota bacterium]|nr:bifunctional oligoribonuclease/PAP phosphatase NrnA [Acidobacteriota bacterium]
MAAEAGAKAAPADLIATVRAGRRFVVASHQRPDGDAIGSAMAMALALRTMGKEATVVTDAVPPVFLQPFPGVDGMQITTSVTVRYDAALIMECGDLSRTGVAGLDRSPVVNIDHHPGNLSYGAINWIDEAAAACGEMVCTLIDALGVPLTPDIATHLYLAVLTDTGSFHFSHLTPWTYEVARRAVEAGADPQWIAQTHYDSNSLARVRIFGAVLNDMVIQNEGKVALLAITRKAMSDLGGTSDDLEGLINFPLTVKEIEAVAFFKEAGDHDWRVSLRSKGAVNVGAIARHFGGGGHKNAAGCSTTGDLTAVQKRFGELMVKAVNVS